MGLLSRLAFSTMKMVHIEIGRAAKPRTARRSMQTERSYTMGDKRGKKNKEKTEKQKVTKKGQQAEKKQDKQPKRTSNADPNA